MREVSYRVGSKQRRNVYRVTPAHPEGVYIGVFFDEKDAALVVTALNFDYEFWLQRFNGGGDEGQESAG